MTYEVIDCVQGTEGWLLARCGLPTASRFADVLAKPVKGSRESKTRRTYMLQLAGERITGQPMQTYQSADMQRGTELEPRARAAYALLHDVEPELVGFIRREGAGCSPDALIGDDGLLEIKCPATHILIDRLLSGEPPPEHFAQVQGQMWITDRAWCDLVLYSPGLPLTTYRIKRDEDYILALARAIDDFNFELDGIVRRIDAYSSNTIPEQRQAFREALAVA